MSWSGNNWAASLKTNKMTMRPAKTQFSMGISPVWSASLLCANWVAKDSSFLHADSKDSDQTGQADLSPLGACASLFVLSWGGWNSVVPIICEHLTLKFACSQFVKFQKADSALISITYAIMCGIKCSIKWAVSSEFGTYRLCEQRRFRRACASTQSRQNLHYSLI